MKLMADAALVGMPSAGKSSLIARMSAAKPKIADYPFTTLVPNLGVVKVQDYSYVVADVPGLIEGAHAGKGLGHEFLRHIERSAIILHVVDLTGGYEGRDPVEDYEIIKRELELYAPELAERPCIVVGNKIDMPGAEEAAKRLAEVVRRDSIARAGGDEFATSPLIRACSARVPLPRWASKRSWRRPVGRFSSCAKKHVLNMTRKSISTRCGSISVRSAVRATRSRSSPKGCSA